MIPTQREGDMACTKVLANLYAFVTHSLFLSGTSKNAFFPPLVLDCHCALVDSLRHNLDNTALSADVQLRELDAMESTAAIASTSNPRSLTAGHSQHRKQAKIVDDWEADSDEDAAGEPQDPFAETKQEWTRA